MNTEKTSLENENQPSCLGAVSGSFLSNLKFIINNMEYDLVKDKISKEAQTGYLKQEYLRRLKLMRDELHQNSR